MEGVFLRRADEPFPRDVAVRVTGDPPQPHRPLLHREHVHQSGPHPGSPRAWATSRPGWRWVFELLEAAEQRQRSVNGPQLVALVRLGARFEEEIPNDQERGQCGRHPGWFFRKIRSSFAGS
jgi:hypothetical protein